MSSFRHPPHLCRFETCYFSKLSDSFTRTLEAGIPLLRSTHRLWVLAIVCCYLYAQNQLSNLDCVAQCRSQSVSSAWFLSGHLWCIRSFFSALLLLQWSHPSRTQARVRVRVRARRIDCASSMLTRTWTPSKKFAGVYMVARTICPRQHPPLPATRIAPSSFWQISTPIGQRPSAMPADSNPT